MERNTDRTIMTCIECDKPAVWVRSTQFAGDHPYCLEHAKQESDFNENDSYTFWYETKPAAHEWDDWRPNKTFV